MAYFDKLNYTLSNEDTRVEYDLLPDNAEQVFTISGSGARVLPLVAKNPKSVTVVDISLQQLYLCELRLEAARKLTYPEFLFFLGYRGGVFEGNSESDDRLELFKKLNLSKESEDFWLEHKNEWLPRGFVLLGKWENHFQKIGKIFRDILRMDLRPIFEAHSLEEQLDLYKKHFKPFVFRNFLRLVANEYVFNKFLYKGHFSGSEKNRTESRSPWKFLDDEFKRLFTTTLVRKNYFLQLLFLGRIYYEEGLPLEAQPHIHAQMKKSQTKVEFRQGDLSQIVTEKPYDFVSLSDTISYLPSETAQNILQKMHPDTKKGAFVVIRSFLKAPEDLQSKNWKSEKKLNQWAFNLDGTGVYQFHIFSL